MDEHGDAPGDADALFHGEGRAVAEEQVRGRAIDDQGGGQGDVVDHGIPAVAQGLVAAPVDAAGHGAIEREVHGPCTAECGDKVAQKRKAPLKMGGICFLKQAIVSQR